MQAGVLRMEKDGTIREPTATETEVLADMLSQCNQCLEDCLATELHVGRALRGGITIAGGIDSPTGRRVRHDLCEPGPSRHVFLNRHIFDDDPI